MENQMNTYLQILAETLDKKQIALSELLRQTKEQENLLAQEDMSMDAFDMCMEKKGSLLANMALLDDGFENVYGRIKEDIEKNKEAYRTQIEQMQASIEQITQTGVELEVLEKRNRDRLEQFFGKKRKEIKNFHVNSQVASKYYKNMANRHQSGNSYFLDKKK